MLLNRSSRCDVLESRIESNCAKKLGGSIIVRRSSMIDLENSVFESNFAAGSEDGVGIVNDGQVQCDLELCLPVCTSCREEVAPSSKPTSQQPTVVTTSTNPTTSFSLWLVTITPCLIFLTMIIGRVATRCWQRSRAWSNRYTAVEHPVRELTGMSAVLPRVRGGETSLSDPLDIRPDVVSDSDESIIELAHARPTRIGSDTVDHSDEPSVERVQAARFVMATYEMSPAPTVAIARCDQGPVIQLWSPGMTAVAPLHDVNPVGRRVQDLPFANAHDAIKLCETLERVFEAPAEHDDARPFVLHLLTKHGAVLLEMTLSVLVVSPEPTVVMTGREVESRLGSLIAGRDESVTESSGINSDSSGWDRWSSDAGPTSPGNMQIRDSSRTMEHEMSHVVSELHSRSEASSTHSDWHETQLTTNRRPSSQQSEWTDVSALTMPTMQSE